MFADIDWEAGRGYHHCGFRGACIGDLIALSVLEASFFEELIHLVEVADIHMDRRDITRRLIF